MKHLSSGWVVRHVSPEQGHSSGSHNRKRYNSSDDNDGGSSSDDNERFEPDNRKYAKERIMRYPVAIFYGWLLGVRVYIIRLL
jgi:hypothetical protein